MTEDFKEGYRDGYSQAVENIRYNIISYMATNQKISIATVNAICDFCSQVDEEYLDQ